MKHSLFGVAMLIAAIIASIIFSGEDDGKKTEPLSDHQIWSVENYLKKELDR